MPRPAAPEVRIHRWDAGAWTEAPDAVVTEEPLELMLDGKPLSVVMRTPGDDLELALGLLHAEGIVRVLADVEKVRISAEAGETATAVELDASIVESNQVDVHLTHEPRRRPERSTLASSACGVCGAVLIEDLRRDLEPLPDGPRLEPALLPSLSSRLRATQGVFEQTGALHAAALFDAQGGLLCAREDVGRHNAVDKVVGRMLLDGRMPLGGSVLMVSGRAGYEIVQKSITAGIPVLVAVGAPTSLAVALAREFNQTLVGFLRDGRFNVYSTPGRLAG